MKGADRTERSRAKLGEKYCTYYRDALEKSAEFRREYLELLNVVKSGDMPFESSPDGLIKHIINERMGTKECCIEAYMQFIPPGKATGKSRHLSEEIAFVVEGRGHDLHWDVRFDCKDEFEWQWEDEPKKFEWKRGDFVYIPPYCIHQRSADSEQEARLLVINNRIIKDMGFDWFDQLENAEGF